MGMDMVGMEFIIDTKYKIEIEIGIWLREFYVSCPAIM